MIGIAVLDCGRIGAMHAANIAAQAPMQDINGATAEAAAAAKAAGVTDTAVKVSEVA